MRSTLGLQYFITPIDDYSRWTWLFTVKDQSEIFSIFQKFLAEFQIQFNVVICMLRMHENIFLHHLLLMTQLRIIHQSSHAVDAQLNVVAKQKKSSPHKDSSHFTPQSSTFGFLGDGVLIACYLINLKPLFVLNNQNPHSILVLS